VFISYNYVFKLFYIFYYYGRLFFHFVGYYAIGGLGRFLVESALLISQVGKEYFHSEFFLTFKCTHYQWVKIAYSVLFFLISPVLTHNFYSEIYVLFSTVLSSVISFTGFCCAYLIFISENLSDYVKGVQM